MSHIQNERLSKVVADNLQERIIQNGLGVGERLPTEPKLMEEFGVSRTVVREAAALLVSRGIVEVRPRRGMTVRAPDGQSVSESLIAQLQMSSVTLTHMLVVRLTLETAIARLAAKERTAEDLAKLRENITRMMAEDVDHEKTIELDIAFHELMAAATHNPFFVLVSRPINEMLRKLYVDKVGYLSLSKQACDDHRAVFEAVEKGDAEAADRATIHHLDRVETNIKKLLAKNVKTAE